VGITSKKGGITSKKGEGGNNKENRKRRK